jgi:hypothetical protein
MAMKRLRSCGPQKSAEAVESVIATGRNVSRVLGELLHLRRSERDPAVHWGVDERG